MSQESLSTNSVAEKAAGNVHFAAGHYQQALESYSKAILCEESVPTDKELIVSCFSNRAACHLKIAGTAKTEKISEDALRACIDDCGRALESKPDLLKALFRRAQAYLLLGNALEAIRNLKELLRIEPKNKEALKCLRSAQEKAEKIHIGISEVLKVIRALQSGKDSHGKSLHEIDVLNAVKSLISLCADDATHAGEFARKGGIAILDRIFISHLQKDIDANREDVKMSRDIMYNILMLIGALVQYREVVCNFVAMSVDEEAVGTGIAIADRGKLSFVALARLVIERRVGIDFVQRILALLVCILKLLPLKRDVKREAPSDLQVEELVDDDTSRVNTVMEEAPYLQEKAGKAFLHSIAIAMTRDSVESSDADNERVMFALDCLSTFLSELPDYVNPHEEVDYRMESMEDRKIRTSRQRVLRQRVYTHALWALECKLLEHITFLLDCEESSLRVRAIPCVGRLVTNACDEKDPTYQPPKASEGEDPPEEDLLVKSYLKDFLIEPKGIHTDGSSIVPADVMSIRKYVSISSALLACRPELGIWALRRCNAMRQIMLLIATSDTRCKDLAAEVICQASATDSGAELLRPLLEGGAIQGLLASPLPSTRAAAAAALTKLSIKAKALQEDSPEVAAVLNAAFDVLRMEVGNLSSQQEKKDAEKVSAAAIVSVERAVEVIAAMVGKTHVKEEIVHGSSRVARATEVLSKLNVDPRSSAAYGLAHIFAAISVTNHELRAAALAEKDMTVEQFEKLQELQRIKTKDKDGNPIEEKKEDEDIDSNELCAMRIKRIATSGGLVCLTRLLQSGSSKTKETAARALRQVCAEPTARGLFIQEGAMKACCDVMYRAASKEKCEGEPSVSAEGRREAAHAVAKALISTDPRLLAAHQRLGVIAPLLALCKDIDGTNLQQFEGLMALTNVLSAGEAEAAKFFKEKGHHAVHYLIFSDHAMVRTAACEVFCNIPQYEETLQMLRNPEKLRLWLGLCEECDATEPSGQPDEEAFKTARACSGMLAMACSDPQVSDALLVEGVGSSLVKLLASSKPELVHRALAILGSVLDKFDEETGTSTANINMTKHVLDAGIVPALTIGIKAVMPFPDLFTMAKATAEKLNNIAKNLT